MFFIWQLIKFACIIYAKCTLSMIADVCEDAIEANNKKVMLNQNGPLNFLRGYIYVEDNIIYNERLYSPGISIDYQLDLVTKFYAKFTPPDYRRDNIPQISSRDSSVDTQYLCAFYKTLQLMFGVDNFVMTVVNDEDGSFYKFLSSEEAQPEVSKLFAALLLISEGVDIPLKLSMEVNEEHPSLELYYLKLEGKVNFIIPLFSNNEHNKLQESGDAKVVLEYFIKHAISWDKIYAKKDVKYEFESGYFMYSPNFLLQAYIYEFVTTKSMLSEIIRFYHIMLRDELSKCKRVINVSNMETLENKLEKYIRVYNRSFTKVENAEQYDYIHNLQLIEKNVNNARLFPFNAINKIPTYVGVRKIKRIIRNSEPDTFLIATNDNPLYANCNEVALLSLLCCFFYDSKAKKYSLEHLPNASRNLKEFFQKYSNPFRIAYNSVYHQAWSEVVSDLPDNRILYRFKEVGGEFHGARNEIQSGWINILMVISLICGLGDEIDELRSIQKMIYKDKEFDNRYGKRFDKCVQSIFTKLFLRGELGIKYGAIDVRLNSKGFNDFYGDISIQFETAPGIYENVALDVYNNYAQFKHSCRSDNQDIPEKIKLYLENPIQNAKEGTFLKTLYDNMVNKQFSNNRFAEDIVKDAIASIGQYATEMDMCAKFNCLFSLGQIDTLEVKELIVREISKHVFREQEKLKGNAAKGSKNGSKASERVAHKMGLKEVASLNTMEKQWGRDNNKHTILNKSFDDANININEIDHSSRIASDKRTRDIDKLMNKPIKVDNSLPTSNGIKAIYDLPTELILYIRLTSNIFASESLDDKYTRDSLLVYLTLYDRYLKYYNTINIKSEDASLFSFLKLEVNTLLYQYIIKINRIDILVEMVEEEFKDAISRMDYKNYSYLHGMFSHLLQYKNVEILENGIKILEPELIKESAWLTDIYWLEIFRTSLQFEPCSLRIIEFFAYYYDFKSLLDETNLFVAKTVCFCYSEMFTAVFTIFFKFRYALLANERMKIEKLITIFMITANSEEEFEKVHEVIEIRYSVLPFNVVVENMVRIWDVLKDFKKLNSEKVNKALANYCKNYKKFCKNLHKLVKKSGYMMIHDKSEELVGTRDLSLINKLYEILSWRLQSSAFSKLFGSFS